MVGFVDLRAVGFVRGLPKWHLSGVEWRRVVSSGVEWCRVALEWCQVALELCRVVSSGVECH